MQWIDDMFVSMEKARAAAALAKGSANGRKVNQTKHLKNEIPGALNAWSALVSSITTDVNEFNKHKERAGQTPVRMSQRPPSLGPPRFSEAAVDHHHRP
jgi:hypothetical protein